MDIDKILLIPLSLSIPLIDVILYWLLILIPFVGRKSRRLQASTSIDVKSENWREEKTGLHVDHVHQRHKYGFDWQVLAPHPNSYTTQLIDKDGCRKNSK